MSNSFMSWLIDRVRCRLDHPLSSADRQVVEAVIDVLRKDAPHRLRHYLMKVMPAQGNYYYQYDPGFHAAVSHFSQIAAAAMLGEIPLTEEQKEANYKEFGKLLMGFDLAGDIYKQAQAMDKWPGEESIYSGTSMMKAVKSEPAKVTMEGIKEVMKEAKSGLPAAKEKSYGPVTMGKSKAKPAKGPDPDEALAKLQSMVEKKSDELLGIKKDDKYKELMGLDPEEI